MSSTYTTTNSGSDTRTTTKTTTNSTSKTTGGSLGKSTSETYAAGKISKNTQANFNKYNGEYQEGARVKQAYQNLQNWQNNKPVYSGTWEGQLADQYNAIVNREKFSYNMNADQMYQNYKEQYSQMGQQAMQDTMAQATAMTGGYGNSYAQTAGQQAYQSYLSELNNMVPTLYNQAYQRYQDEGAAMKDQYGMLSDLRDKEYGAYRDEVGDWQVEGTRLNNAYYSERDFDYGKWSDNRNYWNDEYWKEKNAKQKTKTVNKEDNWSTTKSKSTTKTVTDTRTNDWTNTTTVTPEETITSSGNSTSRSRSYSPTTTTSSTTSNRSSKTSSSTSDKKNVSIGIYKPTTSALLHQPLNTKYALKKKK